MKRQSFGVAAAIVLCLAVTVASGEPRGKGAEKQNKGGERQGKEGEKQGKGNEPHHKGGETPSHENKGGGKSPGGAWSDGKSASTNQGKEAAEKNRSSQPGGTEGVAAERASGKNKPSQASGAEGAAAGAAAANRNKPAATGAEGAAAGAAVSNRNKPAASGAQGAALGAAAANRNQPAASGLEGAAAGATIANRNQTSGAAAATAGYAAVANSFDHPNLYNQQWHSDHPGAWRASGWPAGAAWTATSMAGVAAYCGYANTTPVSYGYGDNVTYQNGNVFVDGRDVGTGEVYSQQAADLAMTGQNAVSDPTEEWLPLGVFALVRSEEQHPQLTLQFAINKQGILQGNYTDLLTDHAQPIHGAVEKESQRAAWTVGNNQHFFMEAGLSNLTSGEAPALIHKYGKTEKWVLVRLPKPDSADDAVANSNSPN
ncbi:hypothetical protein [Schlesneria paludicola]|uniref:hypothetical protein n=1 Tax=Schlesneria paludicola TaxID=360056 RepID=UPI00029A7EA3|nr:hypothetical protein [Schlesneria paludicola]